MKKIIFTIFLITNLVQAETYNDRILVYINNDYLDFEIGKSSNRTNNNELNEFLKNYDVQQIIKWLPHAKQSDRDEDIFLNRFYVIKLNKKSDILDYKI